MEVAQITFISSTFWTERIGPTAALKTLEVMDRIKSWEIITKTGAKVVSNWKKIAKEANVEISVFGIPAISSYSFKYNNLKFKTYVTQEMLKKGFLASTNFYASTAHNDNILNSYFDALSEVYASISKCISGDKDIDKLLESPVCHDGFYRLN